MQLPTLSMKDKLNTIISKIEDYVAKIVEKEGAMFLFPFNDCFKEPEKEVSRINTMYHLR